MTSHFECPTGGFIQIGDYKIHINVSETLPKNEYYMTVGNPDDFKKRVNSIMRKMKKNKTPMITFNKPFIKKERIDNVHNR